MEILYVRDFMPNDKWATKEYYFEDMLEYLVDDTGYVKGLYYVDEDIGGKKEYYIYDTITRNRI